MRPDDVLQLLRAKPFQPFRISLSDGQQYDVRHPEIAIVSRSTVLVGIPGPRGPNGPVERVVALWRSCISLAWKSSTAPRRPTDVLASANYREKAEWPLFSLSRSHPESLRCGQTRHPRPIAFMHRKLCLNLLDELRHTAVVVCQRQCEPTSDFELMCLARKRIPTPSAGSTHEPPSTVASCRDGSQASSQKTTRGLASSPETPLADS